ncbi:unnamed protein product, partial [Prorocentrum cordatum]
RPLQAAVKFQPKGMRGVSPRAPARSKRRCCCPGQPPRKRQPDGGWQASGSVAVASPSPASRLGQRSTHPRGLCLSTPAVCAACPEASGSESWTCSAAAEAAAAAAVAHRYVEIHSGVGAVSGEVPPRCRNVLAASRGQRPAVLASRPQTSWPGCRRRRLWTLRAPRPAVGIASLLEGKKHTDTIIRR